MTLDPSIQETCKKLLSPQLRSLTCKGSHSELALVSIYLYTLCSPLYRLSLSLTSCDHLSALKRLSVIVIVINNL